MAATVPAAFPFVEVTIDTSLLQPTAQRNPGVIAIVGSTGGAGSAPVNTPLVVDTPADAQAFAEVVAGVPTPNDLYNSLLLALLQDPRPSKIYGVKTSSPADWDAALASLDAADDVTFVSLANVTDLATLAKLKTHAEVNSAAGQKRIAVMMVDPTSPKTSTYAADLNAAWTGTPNLKSDVSRVLVLAARGATVDVASAGMAAIAGYAPPVSIVLKQIRGVDIPVASQYTPAEIKALSENGFVPIVQPSLVVGGGFYFGEGRLFTTDASLLFVDLVRTLDDIDFRLKAGLIGLVGDARITRAGLTLVKTRVDGILGPLVRDAVIDSYTVDIPVLNILSAPESTRTAAENQMVVDSRANRSVDMFVGVTYGPAFSLLKITLMPKF